MSVSYNYSISGDEENDLLDGPPMEFSPARNANEMLEKIRRIHRK
jgi:hypothetical protein